MKYVFVFYKFVANRNFFLFAQRTNKSEYIAMERNGCLCQRVNIYTSDEPPDIDILKLLGINETGKYEQTL